jgi:hypothetical protein
VSVKFQPVSNIKTRLGIQKYGPAHKFFANNCMNRMNARYTPEREGENGLTGSSIVDEKCNIIYQSPYAHYLYKGKLYVDPETGSSWAKEGTTKVPTNKNLKYHKSGTGPHWDKKMVSAEIKDIERETNEYVKRGCK